MFRIIDKNGQNNIFRIISENTELLNPISIHNIFLSKYALILAYYPMKQSKYNVFIKLNKHQKVGMLNRHILGVASKLGIYQTIIKEILELRKTHKRCRNYSKGASFFNSTDKDFWKTLWTENQKKLTKQYDLLLDIILEEISRREKSKYLRKKKLEEIFERSSENN